MTISVFNSKGGVGKTVTAVNLAATVSRAPESKPVLLIDSDGQYSATNFFLSEVNAADQPHTVHDVLFTGCALHKAAVAVAPNLFLVPSDPRMINADRQLPDEAAPDLRFKRALKGQKRWGTVLIDVPSGWGAVARNAVLASKTVIVPINGEKMAFDTAIDTTERIAHLCDAYDQAVPKIKILLTAFRDTAHTRDIVELCEETWGRNVLKTRIRYTEKVRALALDHKTVADRAAGSAREDYEALSQEMSTWR